MGFQIDYTPEAQEHLRGLTAREQRTVLDKVEEQLSNQPTTQTRNRKPLRANSLAGWELRIGDLRVYYNVAESPAEVVVVKAIGVKSGNIVRIGGEEVEL